MENKQGMPRSKRFYKKKKKAFIITLRVYGIIPNFNFHATEMIVYTL